VRTRDITLLPIGGIARLERMPEKPSQELVVAVAGPAVNLVIAAGLGLVLHGLQRPFVDLLMRGSLLESLLAVNVWMILFNMIPAFPMDGGRVLRSLLAMRLPFERATRIASGIGQFVALLFGAAGLFTSNVMLMFIALFVFLAAGEERATVQTRASIQGLPVRDGMLTEFRWLEVGDPLGLAVRYLMAGSQTEFPVIEHQRPVGVLNSSALIAALARVGPDAPVGAVVDRSDETCDVGEPLDGVLVRMRSSGRGALPVMNQGTLVGLLTLDNAGELLLVRNAIRRYHGDAKA
jgi:CBS domain-containing protein